MEKNFCVYILASKRNGTLYIGVTSDLMKRIWQHKNNQIDGFTKEHTVHKLVFYEQHFSAESAIRREKRLKEWTRRWKLALIEKTNPDWIDLYEELLDPVVKPRDDGKGDNRMIMRLKKSPLDIEGVDLHMSAQKIVNAVRESRAGRYVS